MADFVPTTVNKTAVQDLATPLRPLQPPQVKRGLDREGHRAALGDLREIGDAGELPGAHDLLQQLFKPRLLARKATRRG